MNLTSVTYGAGFTPVRTAPALVEIDSVTGEILVPGTGPAAVRAWIMNLTNTLLAMPGEKAEFPVEHSLIDGMYMRKLFIPKGSLVIGKIHKLDCMNIVALGDISIVTETGSARVKAGFSVASPAGLQKVGYAHEDTIFINVFRTSEVDIEKIERAIAWDSFEAAGFAPPMIEGK